MWTNRNYHHMILFSFHSFYRFFFSFFVLHKHYTEISERKSSKKTITSSLIKQLLSKDRLYAYKLYKSLNKSHFQDIFLVRLRGSKVQVFFFLSTIFSFSLFSCVFYCTIWSNYEVSNGWHELNKHVRMAKNEKKENTKQNPNKIIFCQGSNSRTKKLKMLVRRRRSSESNLLCNNMHFNSVWEIT